MALEDRLNITHIFLKKAPFFMESIVTSLPRLASIAGWKKADPGAHSRRWMATGPPGWMLGVGKAPVTFSPPQGWSMMGRSGALGDFLLESEPLDTHLRLKRLRNCWQIPSPWNHVTIL